MSIAFKISLVADQNALHIVSTIFFSLTHPAGHFHEAVAISYVVHYDNTMRAFIVAASDCFEALLTCSVPDLQLDLLIVHRDRFELEIDANGWHVVACEFIFSVASEQRGFADS